MSDISTRQFGGGGGQRARRGPTTGLDNDLPRMFLSFTARIYVPMVFFTVIKKPQCQKEAPGKGFVGPTPGFPAPQS